MLCLRAPVGARAEFRPKAAGTPRRPCRRKASARPEERAPGVPAPTTPASGSLPLGYPFMAGPPVAAPLPELIRNGYNPVTAPEFRHGHRHSLRPPSRQPCVALVELIAGRDH